ncbi:armadillo-type protein [Calycina marina]|uniref:Armadillo-type protein n=1 Tax=Calycina marina TaxID=1763456 RepID=A0A9P7ZB16_9HELO|nr:armadillo-type protein [Calycina marina]
MDETIYINDDAPIDVETFTSASHANEYSRKLSEKELDVIMSSIQHIFKLEEESQSEDVSMVGDDIDEPAVDPQDQERRKTRLRSLLSTLAHLWWSDSEHMDAATEMLANGSRDPKWRLPMGESGVLNFFLEILSAHELRHTLKIQALRLMGNSCADTDENRARVVSSNYLPSLISQLRTTLLLPFVIPVLYNICIDYSNPKFRSNMAFIGYSCKLLELLTSQPSETELAPGNAAVVLLNLAADRTLQLDVNDFIALTTTAVLYLQHERFQQAVIIQGALDTALTVLADSYRRFDFSMSLSPSSGDEDDEDTAKNLTVMRGQLNQALSDISALPDFKNAVPVMSPLSSYLRRWLSSPHFQLQVCACIMLGNLARSDATCEEFVRVFKVHVPLIAILDTANDAQLLHAALGFLKNLALPLNNKLPIGEAGIFDVLPRLWALDVLQQVQFSSISLSRQLLISTYDNIRKITVGLSEDQDSPANMRSKLSLLIALFQRTDVEPIKMEISRLITAICRTYNSGTDPSQEHYATSQKTFFQIHPDVGIPLGFMVSQTKWPVMRSEGWFVFALMARDPEGAQCISDMMQDVNVFQPLVGLLTGKDHLEHKQSPYSPITSPASDVSAGLSLLSSLEGAPPESAKPSALSADMVSIDRENAMVLVSELLKNRGSEMALMRRTLFEDLLKGGGDMILSSREVKAGDSIVPRDRRDTSGLGLAEISEQSFRELS